MKTRDVFFKTISILATCNVDEGYWPDAFRRTIMTETKVGVGVSLDKETLRYVDMIRGQEPRSRALENLINLGIVQQRKYKRMDG